MKGLLTIRLWLTCLSYMFRASQRFHHQNQLVIHKYMNWMQELLSPSVGPGNNTVMLCTDCWCTSKQCKYSEFHWSLTDWLTEAGTQHAKSQPQLTCQKVVVVGVGGINTQTWWYTKWYIIPYKIFAWTMRLHNSKLMDRWCCDARLEMTYRCFFTQSCTVWTWRIIIGLLND